MDELESTYITNASKFILFKWIALMDEGKCDVNEFLYLLCDDFELNFRKNSPITCASELSRWIRWSRQLVIEESHLIGDMEIIKLSEDECRILFNIEFLGLSRRGKVLSAHTKHEWYLASKDSKMPKIKRIDVDIVSDFVEVDKGFESRFMGNKAFALVYRFFSLVDTIYYDKHVEDIIGLLDCGFEVTYPMSTWHDKDDIRQYLLANGKDCINTSYINKIDIINREDNITDLTLELLWEKKMNNGEMSSLRYGYDFKIIDYGGFLPNIKYINAYLLD